MIGLAFQALVIDLFGRFPCAINDPRLRLGRRPLLFFDIRKRRRATRPRRIGRDAILGPHTDGEKVGRPYVEDLHALAVQADFQTLSPVTVAGHRGSIILVADVFPGHGALDVHNVSQVGKQFGAEDNVPWLVSSGGSYRSEARENEWQFPHRPLVTSLLKQR
jgi:hypothetical protein